MPRNRKHKKARRPPLSVAEAFARQGLADVAFKKLYFDEPLTDAEYHALLSSDYVKPSVFQDSSVDSLDLAMPLYEGAKFELATGSPFLFSDVEREILRYFGRHPELLFSLPPRKFEELVASIFRQGGFEVELTPQTRDGGIDIIAVRRGALTGKELHLIECKRYLPHNTVGIGIVQRMLGVVEQHRATKGVIITTSSFTRDAASVAECARHRLELTEYQSIAQWLANFSQNAT